MLRLPIDAVPDVTNVQVQVLTNSPGLAPEEVERFITFPVETAMSGLPRVGEMRSVSRFGLSVVTVVFEEGTDIYWARQLVSERLSAAREEIPAGYGEPTMGPISSGLGEIYQFEVKGDPMCGDRGPGAPDTDGCYTPMELRTILDWFVNYQLRSVPGIVEGSSFGGLLKTYLVTLDPPKLTAYNLSVGDVLEALRENNRNVGGGSIAHEGEQDLVRGEGLIESLEDLRDIVLAHDAGGTPVYVSNVGRVELAPMFRQGAVTRDGGGEAVVGIVMMLMGESSRVVVDGSVVTVGIALASFVAEARQAVRSRVELPPGWTLDWGGQLENLRAASQRLAVLVPLALALATSAGAEVQRPLATVVIGGLVTSTVLTLLVPPTAYAWLTGRSGAEVVTPPPPPGPGAGPRSPG